MKKKIIVIIILLVATLGIYYIYKRNTYTSGTYISDTLSHKITIGDITEDIVFCNKHYTIKSVYIGRENISQKLSEVMNDRFNHDVLYATATSPENLSIMNTYRPHEVAKKTCNRFASEIKTDNNLLEVHNAIINKDISGRDYYTFLINKVEVSFYKIDNGSTEYEIYINNNPEDQSGFDGLHSLNIK